jgi:hypothetical protein
MQDFLKTVFLSCLSFLFACNTKRADNKREGRAEPVLRQVISTCNEEFSSIRDTSMPIQLVTGEFAYRTTRPLNSSQFCWITRDRTPNMYVALLVSNATERVSDSIMALWEGKIRATFPNQFAQVKRGGKGRENGAWLYGSEFISSNVGISLLTKVKPYSNLHSVTLSIKSRHS